MDSRRFIEETSNTISGQVSALIGRYEPYMKEAIDSEIASRVKRLVDERCEAVLGRALLDAMRIMLVERKP